LAYGRLFYGVSVGIYLLILVSLTYIACTVRTNPHWDKGQLFPKG